MRKRAKSSHRQEKNRKNKHSSCSSSDEDLERIKSRSRKKKKWYDSEEDLSSKSDYSGSQSESERDQKKYSSRKREKKRRNDSSESEHKGRLRKKSITGRNDYSPEDESLGKLSYKEKQKKWGNGRLQEDENRGSDYNPAGDDLNDSNRRSQSHNKTLRKEMGLEWMLIHPKDGIQKTCDEVSQTEAEEALAKEIKNDNPRELNPYLKDSGSGYPEETELIKTDRKQLLSSSVVGDGGASWRLKALKRSQEQAAREGKKLHEVVEERWGSMGHFAASVASHNVAPNHAHLHAIKNRRRGLVKEELENVAEEISGSAQKDSDRRSGEDIHPWHTKMRVPKVQDSLSWGKRRYKNLSTEDTALVAAAMSGLNKFSNDGSFMDKFTPLKDAESGGHGNSSAERFEDRGEITTEDAMTVKPPMSANQLAAKALQLRMKGKLAEAEEMLKEAEKMKEKHDTDNSSSKMRIDGTTSRYIVHDASSRQKKKDEDADLNLAKNIMHNHRYSISSQADDEYDYDDGPGTKAWKKGRGENRKSSELTNSAKRFMTQQDRCQFCFDNPTRPKHLAIAIANLTYLTLPQMQPIAMGHCYIVTLQHESSTRAVDDNVWDEIRNFKKCLIMMFSKQERDVVFLETVLGLSSQRRHCLVDCVPLPREIAKQAPVYFKKAIDEAEDEWSQHNAKKLIDTSVKGLRNSIPKNFPYFHVEFGLDKGFVHVIDDEKGFKSSFGLDVLRGMLQLPAEDMHRRWRHESLEKQKQAVASFARDWEPFDWTKQLD
ncbi:hypothetical protein F511_09484 [Dorcoceras hygrometricum]|uniref:CWF19-like protein 2 n=1 Tax=Dorcoceras hygrometricum TaxID=472368 RepID=A0A2Z7CZV8_9LAMI|nr:hypothetical protein F511_09484 [Dorcoceras hygrometricum]